MVETCVIRLQVIEGPNMRDQIVFCTFHSFLVEVQMNERLHTCDAWVITNWRLGLWALLVPHKKLLLVITKGYSV